MLNWFRKRLAIKAAILLGIVSLSAFLMIWAVGGLEWRAWLIACLFSFWIAGLTFFLARHFLNQPIKRMIESIRAAASGNFLQRAQEHSDDELGQLIAQFNNLLIHLTDIQASKIDTDIELDVVQQQLKFKTELEEKNQIIEETNRNLTRRLEDLALLYDVNRSLSSTLELHQVFHVIIEKIGKTLNINELVVLLLDAGQSKLEICSTLGMKLEKDSELRWVDPLRGLFSKALRTRELVYVEDLAQTQTEDVDQRYLPSTGSFLGIPMFYKDKIFGLLNFVREEKDAFSLDEIKLLTSLTQLSAMSILNARLFQEKLDLSTTDELTKLANRRMLQNRMEYEWNRAQRQQSSLSLLMIDIDHFKRYNDINGHLLGDQVLEKVARILESNTRKVDTVARFGGEEFVVILPEQDKAKALSIADKLRKAVYHTQFYRAHSLPSGRITISIGVATFPGDAEDLKNLLDHSDLALYVAKRGGRNQISGYESDMEKVTEERHKANQEFRDRRRRRRRTKPKFPITRLME